MKKYLMVVMFGLLVLSGCDTASTSLNSTQVQAKGGNLFIQDFPEIATSVTKFYDSNTGKLMYVMDGMKSNGVAMIDGDPSEPISEHFLQTINVREIPELDAIVVIIRDNDNGNIVVISDGTYSGDISVQAPNERMTSSKNPTSSLSII